MMTRHFVVSLVLACCCMLSAFAVDLYQAVKDGNLPAVQEALRLDPAGINTPRTSLQFTPLHLAIAKGHTAIAVTLIDGGANVAVKTRNKITPLHLASFTGNTQLAKLLLDKGADANEWDFNGMTSLMMASWENHLPVVELLLTRKVLIDKAEVYGWTALHYAAWAGHDEIVKYLLAQGANIRAADYANKQTPIHKAAMQGRLSVIKYLIAQHADMQIVMNNKNISAVFTVTPTMTTVVEELLWDKERIILLDGDEYDQFCKAHPEWANHPQIIHSREGNDLRRRDVTTLFAAVVNDNPNFGLSSTELLYLATGAGDIELMETLVAQGANVNGDLNIQMVPFYAAFENKQMEAFRYLIDHGANLNVQLPNTNPLGLLAVQERDCDLLHMLLKGKLNPNQRYDAGQTLLHKAVSPQMPDSGKWPKGATRETVVADQTPIIIPIITMLIDYGANVNAVSDSGFTPLFLAEDPRIAELLVARGAILFDPMWKYIPSLHANMPLKMRQWYDTRDNQGLKMRDVDLQLCQFASLTYNDKARILKDIDTQLALGANPNIQQANGMTPLLLAVRSGYTEVVQRLLEQKANPNKQNFIGMSPLMMSIEATDGRNKARLLLAHGADPNLRDKDGNTILLLAADKQNADFVALLWLYKPDPNCANAKGATPLTSLFKKNVPVNAALLADLIAHGSNARVSIADTGMTPLHYAAEQWDGSVIEERPVTSGGETPMMMSTGKADPSKAVGKTIAELMIKQNGDVNARNTEGWTPLMVAADKRRVATAQLLLEHGADPNVKDKHNRTALLLAVQRNCVDIARMLVAKGSVLSDDLLFEAKRYEMIHYLTEQKLNVNVKNAQGSMPVHTAVWSFTASTLESLLAYGADANAKNGAGKTPLQMLEENRGPGSGLVYDAQRKYVLLYAATGQVQRKANDGTPLIHMAAALDLQYAVETLRAQQVDIDSRDAAGNTPLFYAVRERYLSMIQYLLDKKCSVNAKNNAGMTALHYLFTNAGNRMGAPGDSNLSRSSSVETLTAISALLIRHGADITLKDAGQAIPIDLLAGSNGQYWPLILTLASDARLFSYRTPDGGMSLLHLAAGSGDQKRVQQLLAAKCPVDALDNRGNTPLQFAVYYGQKTIAAVLLDNRANVTVADKDGMTALHTLMIPARKEVGAPMMRPARSAPINQNIWYDGVVSQLLLSPQDKLEVAKWLLDRGANVNARTLAGKTPLALLPKYDAFRPVIELLKERGGTE